MLFKLFYSFFLTLALTATFNSVICMEKYNEFMTNAIIKKQNEFNDPIKQKEAVTTKKRALLLKAGLYGTASVTTAGLSASAYTASMLTYILTAGAYADVGTTLLALSPLFAAMSAYCGYKCLSKGIQWYRLTPQNVFNDDQRDLIAQIKNVKSISYEQELDLQMISVIQHRA